MDIISTVSNFIECHALLALKIKNTGEMIHLGKRAGRAKFKTINPTAGKIWINMIHTFASSSY